MLEKLFGCFLIDPDSFFLVILFEHYLDNFALFGRDGFADVISLNRQLAVLFAAVDQNGELYAVRATEIHQLVERGADRATRIKNIVH